MPTIRKDKIKAILNSCLSDAGVSDKTPNLRSFTDKATEKLQQADKAYKAGDSDLAEEMLNNVIHIVSAAKKFNKYFRK